MDAIYLPDRPVSGFVPLGGETGNHRKPNWKQVETNLSHPRKLDVSRKHHQKHPLRNMETKTLSSVSPNSQTSPRKKP